MRFAHWSWAVSQFAWILKHNAEKAKKPWKRISWTGLTIGWVFIGVVRVKR
jgi:hypothetical protein